MTPSAPAANGTAVLKIDFVSDVVCPWCAIGLKSLEAAIERSGVAVALHFQPFELNPDMAPEGEDIIEHISRKYGSTPDQVAQNQERIRERGAAVGFDFGSGRTRIYNTFDAHRLLHWAGLEGRQQALKEAVLGAYFTDGKNPADHAVLAACAVAAGLDGARAAAVLAGDDYAGEVRARERFYHQQGIHGVPAIIFNDRHLIEGGQPVEVFERALRQLAAQPD